MKESKPSCVLLSFVKNISILNVYKPSYIRFQESQHPISVTPKLNTVLLLCVPFFFFFKDLLLVTLSGYITVVSSTTNERTETMK